MSQTIGFNDLFNKDDFNTGVTALVNIIKGISVELDKAKVSASGLATVLGANLKRDINNLSGMSKTLAKDIQEITNKMNQFKQTTAQTDLTIKAYEKETARLTAELEKLRIAQDKVNTSVGGTGKAATTAKTNFTSLSQSFLGVAAGAALVYKGVTILKEQIGLAIQSSMDFERVMKEVQAVSGATGDELKLLTDNANKLGASTEKTALQVAEAQKELAKLGFTTPEILLATEAIVNLSTATGEDLTNSAIVAASTIKSFRLDVSDLARVTDIMTKSFVISALDLEKFRESIKLVAPIAANAGVDIETVTAAISKLADTGISGSLAGTAMRNLLSSMADPSEKLVEYLGRYDETLKDGVKSSEDFTRALKVLKGANIDLETAVSMVDVRARSAFFTLVNYADDVEYLALEFKYLDGETEKVAASMRDTLANDVAIANSAFDSLRRNLADEAIPTLRGLTQGLTQVIEGLRFGAVAIKEFNTTASEVQDVTSFWDNFFAGMVRGLANVSDVILLGDSFDYLFSKLEESNNINRVNDQFESMFTNVDDIVNKFTDLDSAINNNKVAQDLLSQGSEANLETINKLRLAYPEYSKRIEDNSHFLTIVAGKTRATIDASRGYITALESEEKQLQKTIDMLEGFQSTVGIDIEQTQQLADAKETLTLLERLRLSQTEKVLSLQVEVNQVNEEALELAAKEREAKDKEYKEALQLYKAQWAEHKRLEDLRIAWEEYGKERAKAQGIEYEKGIKDYFDAEQAKIDKKEGIVDLENDIAKSVIAAGKELFKADEKLAKEQQDNLDKYNEEQVKAEEEKWEDIVAKAEFGAQKLSEITRMMFDNGAINRENEMRAIDAWEQERLSMAGDNEQAKALIEKEAEERRKKVRIEQAKADKKEALFQIAIATAVNVVKLIGTGQPWLVAAAIAAGLLQAAVVASKPLPAFEKGTNYSPEGHAVVGERGRELIVDGKTGKTRLSSERASITHLSRGSKVIPAHLTERLLSDPNFDHNGVAEKYLNKASNIKVEKPAIDYDMIGRQFKDAVTQIPLNKTVFDENGVTNYVIKRTSTIRRINKRY